MNRPIGCTTALVTPFKNGRLDEETFYELAKRQIRLGVDVISPMGTTGESPTVSHDEHKQCIRIAIEAAKGTNVKVLAGAGSNCTDEAVDLAIFAQEAGADAVLAIAPYCNKPTQEGLFQHYKKIAQSVQIGVMLYNVPGRTAVDIKPQTVKRLADECENIYAIKEASGSMERCVELGVLTPNVAVLCGDDCINFPVLANGGKGLVSVTSNLLPDRLKKLTDAAMNGDFATAKLINDELFELNKALFSVTNPIPIKAAMHIAGLMPTLEYRLPLTGLDADEYRALETCLAKYEIKK